MKVLSEEKDPITPGLRIMQRAVKKKRKKTSSGNVLNIRVDLDSRKFEGPLRDKIRSLVRDEIMRTFNLICSHCNRRYNYDEKKQNHLFLVGSSELTQRQKEVMELVIQGKSDRQISRYLGIEINTVRNHMKSIKTKLGVHTRSEAGDEYKRLKEEGLDTGT